MPNDDKAVANPPAGGPQEFASTNDENINNALHDKPWVVAISAHGQVGVHSRYATREQANTAAAAARAVRPRFADVKVVKENDPDNGLPALLAEVEGAEVEDTTTPTTSPTPAKAGK